MHKPGSDQDSCEHASLHECRCRECGGTLHKWRGLLELASARPTDPTGSGRAAWIAKRVSAWVKRTEIVQRQRDVVARREGLVARSGTRGYENKLRRLDTSKRQLTRNLLTSQAPAADYIEARLVQKLVGETEKQKQRRSKIDYLLNIHAGHVLEALKNADGIASQEDQDILYSGVAGSHIWCGLLAAESGVLKLSNLNAKSAAEGFFKTLEGQAYADEKEAILDAVKTAWEENEGLVEKHFHDQADFGQCLQIAAIFICPAPEAHRDLISKAIVPIVDELLASDEHFVSIQACLGEMRPLP